MPIEEVCAGCKFLPTKSGQQPQHLTAAINAAIELDALKSAGATFAYPDVLTAFEWICLTALQSGRSTSEARSMRERQQEADENSQRSRLEQMRKR